ncbi:phytanoyl-CoA dioxygenase family protein [Marinivivus vitaminiproducens]|uniref:phytanoyl-CoA dioxygenase family protein n=1 Tax=Marinivivus vitaminiproducens TaxID=3035935 RepID=UPI0027A1DB75|nr:phytanoyl-CoA dioxygenase family protein [Geminicoccaceae bacterium SCSIO 64248]
MVASSTKADAERFQRDGIVFPIRVMDEATARENRAKLETLAAAEGGKLSSSTNQKPHLLLPWLNDLIRKPEIVDPVADILGPNVLCWASGFFWKPAGDPGFISWHQDSTYWGLSHADIVTAWVAFSPSTPESGNMRVVPGTHTTEQIAHKDTFDSKNMLSRGQEIAVDVDEDDAIDVTLRPGEMSIHHVRLFHGSQPNRASEPRIGYAIRFIPTYISQTLGIRDSATLVRGVDEHNHFDPEPRPEADFHPDAVAFHATMLERQKQILYAGAAQTKDFAKPATAM